MKKILLYLNTNFHIETVLSLYASIKNINCEPFIFFENENKLNFKKLCKKYNLNLLSTDDFNLLNLQNFDYSIIITGSIYPNPKFLPPGNIEILKLLSNKKILNLYHIANYKDHLEFHSTFFKKLNGLSVTTFSQKYNLDFIYQTDNILTKFIKPKTYLNNDKIKFIVPCRFNYSNRSYEYIDEIIKNDHHLNKSIEINFIGESPEEYHPSLKKVQSFLKYKNLKNIFFKIDFNLDEIDFYEKINSSDFILNLIDPNLFKYFYNKFTSNINHIIAFNKPNFTHIFLSNIYNIPGYQFVKYENFGNVFCQKILELNNYDYEIMCNNFDILKNNMYNHNKVILNRIINNL